jgi:hypothetical protein
VECGFRTCIVCTDDMVSSMLGTSRVHLYQYLPMLSGQTSGVNDGGCLFKPDLQITHGRTENRSCKSRGGHLRPAGTDAILASRRSHTTQGEDGSSSGTISRRLVHMTAGLVLRCDRRSARRAQSIPRDLCWAQLPNQVCSAHVTQSRQKPPKIEMG